MARNSHFVCFLVLCGLFILTFLHLFNMTGLDFSEAYLRLIVERYADAINLGEQKSIAELKASVSPDCPGVAELSALYPSTRSAFDFVFGLKTVHESLPVSFWLDFKEMVSLGAGDAFDKARLLCALLLCHNRTSRVRIVQMRSSGQHALVWLDETPVSVMDVVRGEVWHDKTIDAALAVYPGPHAIQKSLYEFNDKEYREL
jgi:hypothetical protein